MKKLICGLLLLTQSAFGTVITTNDGTVCDFSALIHNKDGSVTYSANLHQCVGKIVEDSAAKDKQIVDYKKAINLYQTTIQTDEQRIQNWIETSTQLNANIQTIRKEEKDNELLYIGLGILGTCAAAYAFGKATGH